MSFSTGPVRGTALRSRRSGARPEHRPLLPAPVLSCSSVPGSSREHLAALSRPGMGMRVKGAPPSARGGGVGGGRAGPPEASPSAPPPAPLRPESCPLFYVSPRTPPQDGSAPAPHMRTRPPGARGVEASPPLPPHPCEPGRGLFPDSSTRLALRRLPSLCLSKVMMFANPMALEGKDVVTMSISLSRSRGPGRSQRLCTEFLNTTPNQPRSRCRTENRTQLATVFRGPQGCTVPRYGGGF